MLSLENSAYLYQFDESCLNVRLNFLANDSIHGGYTSLLDVPNDLEDFSYIFGRIFLGLDASQAIVEACHNDCIERGIRREPVREFPFLNHDAISKRLERMLAKNVSNLGSKTSLRTGDDRLSIGFPTIFLDDSGLSPPSIFPLDGASRNSVPSPRCAQKYANAWHLMGGLDSGLLASHALHVIYEVVLVEGVGLFKELVSPSFWTRGFLIEEFVKKFIVVLTIQVWQMRDKMSLEFGNPGASAGPDES